MENPHQKKIALSLSAFILPGLGQLHLKKRAKGWVMILLCFLDIIFVFAKFLMGLLIISQNNPQKREPLAQIGKQLWQAALLQKEWLVGGLIFLLIIWGWSVVDILKDKKHF